MTAETLLKKLIETKSLTAEEFTLLIQQRKSVANNAQAAARELQNRHYGNKIYMRGLIEVSNICKNGCKYCGIRCENDKIIRYRLSMQDILGCCRQGYDAGYRTFVLQGGEDPWFTDDRCVQLLLEIKRMYPDCAVTLSLGERSHEGYKRFREAGADRYLLRFETANYEHYAYLHPTEMSFKNRLMCLDDLKNLGYALGTGFLVGAPGEKDSYWGEDMALLCRLKPDMVGIGPFLPHGDTPFRNSAAGSMELTLFILSLVRIMLPKVLLPATTAVNTLENNGREQAVLHGANVVMPNLSPPDVRDKYMLYDGKKNTGAEALEGFRDMQSRMEKIGYQCVVSRGDPASSTVNN